MRPLASRTPLRAMGEAPTVLAPDAPTLAGAEPQRVSPHEVELERGATVGRYVVVQRLGSGAMGVVYAAYDPELDRKVALKLLLPGTAGASGRARLLREAQTLGKLSHPNVVAIHDVGTVGEQVWLAMELVQGQTLRQWLETPRSWPAVVRVMRSAGEGLAAAHAAELLHRDFKPDNVMVGDDGRVRVMDFGLARMRASPTLGSEDTTSSPTSAARSAEVTRAGNIVGTPGYMAPEQFAVTELTAAADQFAFCVTLWEALHGERPFGGSTFMEIAAHVLGGRRRPPAKGAGVPGWLRRACERGLAVDPAQRWSSMHALLETLAKGRARARARTGLAAVGVLATLGIGAEGLRRLDVAQRTAACEVTGDEIAGAWSPARAQALRDALVGTGVSDAAATADKTTHWLEQQATAWQHARVDACLDADVRGRWDADTLDRSLWCLDERRMQLQSLVDELTLADAEVLQQTVRAAAGLESVAACRDERALASLTPPPAEQHESIRAVRERLAAARGREWTGRYVAGLEQANEALALARTIEWRPLTAAAQLRVGSLLDETGDYAGAEVELEAAFFAASGGVAPEVVVDAATKLVRVAGTSSARPVDGLRWGHHAEIAFAKIPDEQGLRRAALLHALADVHQLAGEPDDARRLYEQSIALLEDALGPEHPEVAVALSGLANLHTSIGEYEAAKSLLERALAIQEAALGPTHVDVAYTLKNLAAAEQWTGNYAEAKGLLEHSRAILEAALGPRHANVAALLNNLAAAHKALEEPQPAEALYRRALEIYDESLGGEHPLVATTLINLAILETEQREHAEAERHHARALAILEETLGPEHPHVAYPLVGLAEVALADQRPADAIAPAERAARVRDGADVSIELRAEAHFALARALWDAPEDGGRDRTRAVVLAMRARDAYAQANDSNAEALVDVDAWLATHTSPR